MVAVSETGVGLPVDVSVPTLDDEPVEGRRVVAVAVTPMELLRPGSHLLQTIAGAGYVDLLLACEDEPVAAPRPVRVLGAGDADGSGPDGADDDRGEHEDLDEPDEPDDPADELRAAVRELGMDELHLHRLALPAPLGAGAEADLVAALSELVGFDPEPGVRILAPAPLPADPGRSVIDRAVRRIVEVYGLPVQRYRCMELSVVDL